VIGRRFVGSSCCVIYSSGHHSGSARITGSAGTRASFLRRRLRHETCDGIGHAPKLRAISPQQSQVGVSERHLVRGSRWLRSQQPGVGARDAFFPAGLEQGQMCRQLVFARVSLDQELRGELCFIPDN